VGPLLLAGDNAQGSLVDADGLVNVEDCMLILILLSMYLNIEKKKHASFSTIG
jgi:hypothetical protein